MIPHAAITLPSDVVRCDLAAQRWHLSHKADARALPLANAHYNRQRPKSRQFCPPGRTLVLLTADASALWVTSWQRAEFVDHAWPGAWNNSLFRNTRRSDLSSELILEAVAATRACFGDPPALGMITFVDPAAIRSTNPGCAYKVAGFRFVGTTPTRGRLVFQLLPGDMPPPAAARPAWSPQLDLFAGAA